MAYSGNADQIDSEAAVTDSNTPEPISIGLDDGYAYTKLALPDGRLMVIPSRARVGRANVTWLNEARHKIAEYETDSTRYAAGEIDGEPTYFDGYPFSGLNRVIVQHGMQQAKLGGHSVHAVSGLPVSAFYLKDGSQRAETVEKKRASLKQPVDPIDGRLAASIAFHDVIPEALAAWYDTVITDTAAQVTLDESASRRPDRRGRYRRTHHRLRGRRRPGRGARRLGLPALRAVGREEAGGGGHPRQVPTWRWSASARWTRRCKKGTVRLYGQDQDISALVREAKQQVVERLHAETRRQLGSGAELDRVLFVGGGSRRPGGESHPRLVPQPGGGRAPRVRQRPRHAQVPALRLRRAGLSFGFIRRHCGSVANQHLRAVQRCSGNAAGPPSDASCHQLSTHLARGRPPRLPCPGSPRCVLRSPILNHLGESAMSDQQAKYFDLLTAGLGYINRVREVTPEEGNPFLSVSVAALRGSADSAQYTHFECRVAGRQAKAIVQEIRAARRGGPQGPGRLHPERPVPGGLHLQEGREGRTRPASASRPGCFASAGPSSTASRSRSSKPPPSHASGRITRPTHLPDIPSRRPLLDGAVSLFTDRRPPCLHRTCCPSTVTEENRFAGLGAR